MSFPKLPKDAEVLSNLREFIRTKSAFNEFLIPAGSALLPVWKWDLIMEIHSQSQEYFFYGEWSCVSLAWLIRHERSLLRCAAFLTPIAPAASLSCRNSQSCFLLESIKNWLARALLYFIRKSSPQIQAWMCAISRLSTQKSDRQITLSLRSVTQTKVCCSFIKIRFDGTHFYEIA